MANSVDAGTEVITAIRQLPLQRYLPVYFQRLLLLRSLLLLALLPVLLLGWQLQVLTWTTATLLWLAVACWLWADWWAYRRWHGYLVQEQVLYLWEGGLGQSWQVLPFGKFNKCSWYNRYFSANSSWCKCN